MARPGLRALSRGLAGLAALLLGAAADGTAALDVAVANVRDGRGHVRVAVCPQAQFLAMHCPYVGEAPAHPGTVLVHLPGIPPGTYAVEAFLDDNDTHVIDLNFLGLPENGIGFSNDAPFRFGPPSFRDAAVRLGPEGGRIALHLRYLLD